MTEYPHLKTLLGLSLAKTVLVKEAERALLAHGIGLSDLALLLELHDAPDGRMRRAELAERLGVTTSGVARQLHPLERIGLVDREAVANDARMALVLLTDAGRRVVDNALPDVENSAADVLAKRWDAKQLSTLQELLASVRF